MSKMMTFDPSQKLESYLAPLHRDFREKVDRGVETLILRPDLVKALEESQNLIIIEYSGLGENPAEILNGARASILLAIDLQNIGDRLPYLKELCSSNAFIEGVIDTSKEIQFSYPLVRSILRGNQRLQQSLKAGEMDQVLNRMIETTLADLRKAKKLHRKLVPMRSQDIGPLSLMSKFNAGISPGGEFFDIFQGGTSLVILLTTCRSYVASSIVLSLFEKWRQIKVINQKVLENFLEELIHENRTLGLLDREKPKLLELLLLSIDLRNLKFEIYRFGETQIVSNISGISPGNAYPLHETYYQKAWATGKLQRGEKWVILSPGLVANFPKGIQGKPIGDFMTHEIEKPARELAHEVFFQLKRKTPGEFLKHDASLIMLEVDANVIVQV